MLLVRYFSPNNATLRFLLHRRPDNQLSPLNPAHVKTAKPRVSTPPAALHSITFSKTSSRPVSRLTAQRRVEGGDEHPLQQEVDEQVVELSLQQHVVEQSLQQQIDEQSLQQQVDDERSLRQQIDEQEPIAVQPPTEQPLHEQQPETSSSPSPIASKQPSIAQKHPPSPPEPPTPTIHIPPPSISSNNTLSNSQSLAELFQPPSSVSKQGSFLRSKFSTVGKMRESQLKMVEKKDMQKSLRAFAMTHEVEKPRGTPTTQNIHAEMDVVKVRM